MEEKMDLYQIEEELMTNYRMLVPENQVRAFEAVHKLLERQIENNDPELQVGLNLVYALPNTRMWKRQCSFLPEMKTANLLIVIGANLDKACVYRAQGYISQFAYKTTNEHEIIMIHETALEIMHQLSDDEINVMQNNFADCIKLLAGYKKVN